MSRRGLQTIEFLEVNHIETIHVIVGKDVRHGKVADSTPSITTGTC